MLSYRLIQNPRYVFIERTKTLSRSKKLDFTKHELKAIITYRQRHAINANDPEYLFGVSYKLWGLPKVFFLTQTDTPQLPYHISYTNLFSTQQYIRI